MPNPRDIPPDNLPIVDDTNVGGLFSMKQHGSVPATSATSSFRVSPRGQAEIGSMLKKHCQLDLAVDSHEMKVAVENLMHAYVYLLKLAERARARKAREETQ